MSLLGLCDSLEKRLRPTPVQPCYLELAQPTIEDGLSALYRRGVSRAIVVPLQLTAGRHVRYDIPGEVGRFLAKTTCMDVSFTEHLGAHPRMLELAECRLHEALEGREPSAGPTEYVLVARGSRDPLVRGEILRVAECRKIHGERGNFEVCFLAINQPTLEQGLEIVLAKSPSRIVVQPHLLYPGTLLHKIQTRVAELNRRNPHIEWILTGALGPDPCLVDWVLDLASEATERDLRGSSLVGQDGVGLQSQGPAAGEVFANGEAVCGPTKSISRNME